MACRALRGKVPFTIKFLLIVLYIERKCVLSSVVGSVCKMDHRRLYNEVAKTTQIDPRVYSRD